MVLVVTSPFSFLTLFFCIFSLFSWCVCHLLNLIQLLATPWTAAHQAPLSMEFSRQEYWKGLPFPLQRIFPTQGSNLGLLHCRQILYHLSHHISPFFPLMSLSKDIKFIYLFKESALSFIDLFCCSLVSVPFISILVFIVFFLQLTLFFFTLLGVKIDFFNLKSVFFLEVGLYC